MANAVAHLMSFTPEGDNAKFGVNILVVNGIGLTTDISIPLTALNQNIAQINVDLKAAVQVHLEGLGVVFSGGDKVILLCGLV